MARLISLGIVAALIVCLGITFYQVIAPFLMPLFLGGMTALLCQPLFQYFLKRCRGRRGLAAAVTTTVIITSVSLPILVGVLLGVAQIITLTLAGLEEVDERQSEVHPGIASLNFSSDTRQTITQIRTTTFQLYENYYLGTAVSDFDIKLWNLTEEEQEHYRKNPNQLSRRRREWFEPRFDEFVEQSSQQLGGMLQGVAAKTLGFMGNTIGQSIGLTLGRTIDLLSAIAAMIIALAVFALALFYFLADGPELIAAAQELIPIEQEDQQELMVQFAASVRAVVLATFLAAFGQGLLTAIALKIVGFDHFFILLIISTFAALIPLAGTWLVWVPCAALLIWNGSWGSAIFLAIFGIAVVGTMDNVIRTYVLQSDTKLHPLLAFVSVLGGLQVMGIWGVFIGPIVACCLHALIEIFNVELKRMSLPDPALVAAAVGAVSLVGNDGSESSSSQQSEEGSAGKEETAASDEGKAGKGEQQGPRSSREESSPSTSNPADADTVDESVTRPASTEGSGSSGTVAAEDPEPTEG